MDREFVGRTRSLDDLSRRSVVSFLLSGAIGGLSVGCNPAAASKKVASLEHDSNETIDTPACLRRNCADTAGSRERTSKLRTMSMAMIQAYTGNH